jgi:hypothetical protein
MRVLAGDVQLVIMIPSSDGAVVGVDVVLALPKAGGVLRPAIVWSQRCSAMKVH